MVIIQNNIFFRLRLRRLAFCWRLGPQITLYSRTLFSRITSLICFFFTCIFCCRRQSYVHNINESSSGMTKTPDHFGYCGCWFSPWILLLASLQLMLILLKRKHEKLLLFILLFHFLMCVWSVAPVLYGWSNNQKKAGTSQVVFLIELLGFSWKWRGRGERRVKSKRS